MPQRSSRQPPVHPAQASGGADTRRLAPEDGLLLLLCRADPVADEAAALLDGPLDWAALVESSVRHAVTPLLWRGLGLVPGAADLIPASAAAEMADLAGRAEVRHRRLYRVIGEVVAALDDAGVPVMALKDIDLAARLYPAPGLRPIGDLDLLIRRDDHAAATAALARSGFDPLPGGGGRYALRYGDGGHLRRAADEVWIDLQWAVAHREWDVAGESAFRFDVEGMWRRAVPAGVEGVRLLVPSAEDMLFHLCLHLEGHRYAELVLFCDIDLLCARWGDRLDWDALVDLALAHGAGGSVERPLAMTRRLLGTALPAGVLERLAAPYVEAALHGPVFDAVGAQHGGLDEVLAAARPPEAVMAGIERAVRRHRRLASAACREVDALARAAACGGPVVVEAAAGDALMPGGDVPPAGPVRLLVTPASETAVRAWVGGAPARRVEVRSGEPALAGEPLALTVRVAVDARPGPVPPAPAPQRGGNRAAALRALRVRAPDDGELAVTVVIREPEAIVAHLSAEVDAADEERLWQADVLVQALEAADGRLDPVALAAAVASAGDGARRGLELARALGGPVPDLGDAARPPPGAPPLRLFEWARHGASALRRDPALRRPFWFAYALSRARGAGERWDVLRELVRPRRGPRPLGPPLARDLSRGVAGLVRPSPVAPRALAHWVEPDRLMPDRP